MRTPPLDRIYWYTILAACYKLFEFKFSSRLCFGRSDFFGAQFSLWIAYWLGRYGGFLFGE